MTKKFPNDNVTCISPWYELRIDADGKIRCCHSIRQEYAESTNLSFLDWFNQDNLYKKNIIEGKESQGCSACYYNEVNNHISHRMQRNFQAAIYSGKYFQESLKQSPAYKRLNSSEKNKHPAFIHVTLSNLCNMKCRMCFPKYSTQVADSFKKLNYIDKNQPTLLDWTSDPVKWQNFLLTVNNNKHLLSLHFMGGEPLYHKKFYEFIDWCLQNNTTDFHLTFVTNGSIYNQDLVSKLKKFKSVQIEISVENFHLSNDYIRIGSKFETIKDNILRYVKDDLHVVLRTVPQALSIEYYDTIIDFALEHNLGFDSNILDNPRHLKCYVLPKNFKDKIHEKIKSKYTYILSNNISRNDVINYRAPEGIRRHIKTILEILNEAEPENIEDLRHKFIKHNKDLDSFSKIKFTEIYPELLEMYAKYSNI